MGAAVSVNFSRVTEREQNLCRHVLHGHNLLQDPVFGANPGHSVDSAAGFVPADGDSARIAD